MFPEATPARILSPAVALRKLPGTEPATEAVASDDSVPSTDEIAMVEMKEEESELLPCRKPEFGCSGSKSKGCGYCGRRELKRPPLKEDKLAPVPAQNVNTEAVPTTKAINETRESPPAPKAVPAVADPKDNKKQAVDSKASGKESNKKKSDDKEKKGGFLRVFKKIFGKD